MLSREEELLDSTALLRLRHLLDDDEHRKRLQDRSSASSNAPRNLQEQEYDVDVDVEELHGNIAAEKDGDDRDGEQGGQDWTDPTAAPSSSPTPRPTWMPTEAPTRQGQKYTIMGTTWYDRNANGIRDSNKEVRGLGGDVEFSHAIAGVQINLVECDPTTGREYIRQVGDEDIDTQASTTTAGVDAKGKPQIVQKKNGPGIGMYKIVIMHGLQRHYMIRAKAPAGYKITTGACNDAIPGFACDYSRAIQAVTDEQRFLQTHSKSNTLPKPQAPDPGSFASGLVQQQAKPKNAEDHVPLGITEGRSDRCVYIDREGSVEFPINFGVMREGDSLEVGTNVALVLAFDTNDADTSVAEGGSEEEETNSTAVEGTPPARRGLEERLLEELVRRATVVDETDNGLTRTTRYLLDDKARSSIGTVTAEVLATSLDRRLAKHGVDLDSVDPKDVIIETTRSDSDASATTELAVAMEVKGHYSPPPEIDFDYIVQDSINDDTTTIRRGLREYNGNCRSQKDKLSKGYTESSFSSVVDTSGARRPGGRGGGSPSKSMPKLQGNNLFSVACAQEKVLPPYFETSLKEIEAKDIAEVRFQEVGPVDDVDEGGPLPQWALGPVAANAGLIALLVGAFIFRRAIGPRYVDEFKELNETKEIDKDELKRFGEGDDISVDSAFYSDDEETEETDRDRKMRHKQREKAGVRKAKAASRRSLQHVSSRHASSRSLQQGSNRRVGNLRDSLKRKSSSRRQKKSSRKLAVSRGSDDSASLEKDSNSSNGDADVVAAKEEERRSRKERARLRKAQSQAARTKRGRNQRKGGDNAKLARAQSDAFLT